MATTADQQVATVEATLRFVQSLSEPQAAAVSRQLERAVMIEVALSKLVGAVEFYLLIVGRPMTLHKPVWDEMRAAMCEARARLRG